MAIATKTIEFGLTLDKNQRESVSEWMDTLKHVYNRGIALLEWLQHYKRLEKIWAINPSFNTRSRIEYFCNNIKNENGSIEKVWALCSPIAFDRRIDKTKSFEKENIETVYFINIDQTRYPELPARVPYAPVKAHWLEKPPLSGFSDIDLRKPFARKRYDKLGNIPQIFVNDFVGSVIIKAWEGYLDPKRPDIRRPKYKRKRDKINCIPCESMRSQATIDLPNNRIKIQGLGWCKIPNLDLRLGKYIRATTAVLSENPEQCKPLQAKLNERTAYLKVAKWIEDDIDFPEEPKGPYKKAIDKFFDIDDKKKAIEKLQELANKRELSKAIHDVASPGAFNIVRRSNKFYLQIVVRYPTSTGNPKSTPIGVDMGLNLLCETTSGVAVKHHNNSKHTAEINRLKEIQSRPHIQQSSKLWRKLNTKIAKLERRKAASRRAHQHYVAGWLVDVNQNMAIKKIEPKKIAARPLPRPSKDGNSYLPNGREEQRVINNALKEAALGQFGQLIEQKAKDRGERNIEWIECNPSDSPKEVLEKATKFSLGDVAENSSKSELDRVSISPGVHTRSKALGRKVKTLRSDSREGERVTLTMEGESSGDSLTQLQAKSLVSKSQTPKVWKRSKRKPVRERKVK